MAKGKYEYWLTEEGLLLLEGWARMAKKMNRSLLDANF